LGGNPGTPQNPGSPATNLLYAGEQFDTNLQMYYNRARYYDQNTGRFNRMDPFAGNNLDPQSLHKYLYANGNPINLIDPSGMMGIGSVIALCVAVAIVGFLIGFGISSMISGIKAKDTVKYWDALLLGGRKIEVKINGEFTTMSANEIIKKYKSNIKQIANEENIPSDLLAGVLYTELRNYARHDLWFDDPTKANSIGPAQLQVSKVKEWLPDVYGGMSNSDLTDRLYDPESAIKILAKCIKFFDRRSSLNIINQIEATDDINERARLSSIMSGVKDAGGIADYASDDYREGARRAYLKVIEMVPGLKE